MEAEQEPVFEIKKWNAVALWAWGIFYNKFRYSH
jgi:hypothetical protein